MQVVSKAVSKVNHRYSIQVVWEDQKVVEVDLQHHQEEEEESIQKE
jgi:hypothetical protein